MAGLRRRGRAEEEAALRYAVTAAFWLGDRVGAAFPNAEAIYETNMQTMHDLGVEGWAALGVDASALPGDYT